MLHNRDNLETSFVSRNSHLGLLRKVSIFRGLPDDALIRLHRQMSVRRWHGGSIVVGREEPGEALYVLAAGEARVVLFGDNGREMTLSVLRPGDFFGETALFDGKPRSANVVAERDTTMLVLDRDNFMDHLTRYPETALQLLTEMAGRIRSANEIINNLALHDVTSRLTRTLLTIAEDSGEAQDDGILIRRRPTQQDLANMVGTCRETVSRALSSMARRGLVVSRGRSLLLRQELLSGARQAA